MTTYYPINENLARASHNMRSMSTYPDGYATREYRASVDKAAALVEEKKQKVSPYYHEKLDALLDSYARRLAQWTDDHNRNGASCPSVLVCGAGNFPVRKKQKQNAREDTLWHEYEEIEAILTKIKAVGTGPVEDQHDGYTYRENNEIMRVQFIFPGKPDDETRTMLKENGFRWAPSQGAWQRQLTANAKYAAHRVIEFLDGNENE